MFERNEEDRSEFTNMDYNSFTNLHEHKRSYNCVEEKEVS